ncbi:tRNA (adenosine(37)-N6)-threonylcarbamoyltransferase complex ATPase subunit type 1 TsaE [Vagococcus entomophilus]|uniref:tRNA threonylcarbamoyladenosine biosynthesis protein TsaE n=1 Tax=Vagococcus entomophilus TaxID=1160095 RepID=A0A430AHQ1_9ENTE|nr:tRNA (adenosine(37)-N6)-threonylcarbamoyltransferase complex ATPase subunit type 1 TsaE [Vagococcus entomophilus]
MGTFLQAGDVLVLAGDLGAGKTTFTKGLAKGLGIKEMIKSPTYTIIREYETGRLPLYHMDVYRVAEGAEELGLDEYFSGAGVCVVEWGELIPEELPENYIKIEIEAKENQRMLKIEHQGSQALERIRAWQESIDEGGNKTV